MPIFFFKICKTASGNQNAAPSYSVREPLFFMVFKASLTVHVAIYSTFVTLLHSIKIDSFQFIIQTSSATYKLFTIISIRVQTTSLLDCNKTPLKLTFINLFSSLSTRLIMPLAAKEKQNLSLFICDIAKHLQNCIHLYQYHLSISSIFVINIFNLHLQISF